MPGRKKIVHGGREVEAAVLDFSVVQEGVAQYKLEDGTILRVKPILVSVLRVEGEVNELGEPVYLLQSLVHAMIDGEQPNADEPLAR